MDSLLPYALIDTVLFIVAGTFLLLRGSFWHPLAMYLIFHGYTVTWRTWQLVGGALPLYSKQPQFDSITPEELSRAILFSDFALAAFLTGSWWAHKLWQKKSLEPIERRVINPAIFIIVAAVCLPVGFYVFFAIRGGTFDDNVFTQTSYFQVMAMWPIGCLTMLIFFYGFRLVLLVPTAVYLALVGTQGYHRFMLLLPLLFLAIYVIQRSRRLWPSLPMFLAGACLLLVFPKLKSIGQAIRYDDRREALRLVTEAFVAPESYEEAVTNELFLDQYAGALSLVDDVGSVYKGSTYLAALTLPIPRVLWQNKPRLGDHIIEVSTPRRPYNLEGRIITYIGESYFNFRHLGIVMIPLFLGFGLTAWCLRATSGPFLRLGRYFYCACAISFLQLFRDGLTSLIVFTVCHNLPMLFAMTLHFIPGFSEKKTDYPYAPEQEGEWGSSRP